MLTVEALKEIYTALGGDAAGAEFSLNVEGLKAIFTALGGDPAEVADLDDIASVCSKIATVASGGSGGEGLSLEISSGTLTGYTIDLTIPEDVESIGARAFKGCAGIKELTIPSGVTYIGDYAFDGIDIWAVITLESSTPPEAGDYIFGEGEKSIQIKVPDAAVSNYMEADGWSTYADNISAITN